MNDKTDNINKGAVEAAKVDIAYEKFQKLATENGWVYNKNQERAAFEAGYQACQLDAAIADGSNHEITDRRS